MNILINKEDKKVLEKYKIEYKKYEALENTTDNVNELLDNINDVMVSYINTNDEPLPEFLELEKVYDEIFNAN